MTIRIPALTATIERRLLINYRLDPAVAHTLLPSSLRPQLVDGCAVSGICLLRLGAMRPTVFNRVGLPPRIGWGAENAAHRIAVEWDDSRGTHQGLYVPRRHSASWLAVAAGGRIFPGVHEHARFEGSENESRIRIALTSRNTTVSVDVAVTSTFASELFPTLDAASAFFQAGSRSAGRPRAMDLACRACNSPPTAGGWMPARCSQCSPASSMRFRRVQRSSTRCS